MQIRTRNESFDLACYNRAACLRLGADKIRDWSKAPAWALPLERNSELITRDDRVEMKENRRIESAPSFVQPAQTVPVRVKQRRVAPSRYMA
jgi:phage terminase large subunit GpA-like protein